MSWLKDVRNIVVEFTSPQTLLKGGLGEGAASNKHETVISQINELIGLIKGVMSDGNVRQSEVEFLLAWLEHNKATLDQWPAKAIFPRLKSVLSDGNLDNEEEKEIYDLLQITLEEDSAQQSGDARIPYTLPAPQIKFANRTFCFTGKFQSGSRSWCVSQIIARGGIAESKISQEVDYLIVGELNSADWLKGKHGRKIAKAIKYRASGSKIVILSEQHWYEQLGQGKLGVSH